MSDCGTCNSNLDALLEMHKISPLTERELHIAAMQFDYKYTVDLWDDYKQHPMVKLLLEKEYIYD